MTVIQKTTYGPTAQLNPIEKEVGSTFQEFLAKPFDKMVEANKVHEQAVLNPSVQLSEIELLQIAQDAEAYTAEFKTYWEKFITAANDIVKTQI